MNKSFTSLRDGLRAAGAFIAIFGGLSSARSSTGNAIGMTFVPIPAGEFVMGSQTAPANWDEGPPRRVAISQPYLISETEVTVAQFRSFRPDAELNPDHAPYAAGVSWDDANAFCRWLSEREGRLHRLPTEAEWEYAARAGREDGSRWETGTEEANPWGVKNLFAGPVEWCLDWYGEYGYEPERDPVGLVGGIVRVVRGGSLDRDDRFKSDGYRRPSNRAGAPPGFGPNGGGAPNPQGYGVHRIGFRVVVGPPAAAPVRVAEAPFVMRGVKQATRAEARRGPDPSVPYFRRRPHLPMPPEGPLEHVKEHRAGLHPSFRHHNHSPGFEVLPNGDALLVIYSSDWEYEPEVTIIGARLRFGADQWDMPSPFVDTPGSNDHAPLLWTEGDVLSFYWGNPQQEGAFPFQYMRSNDCGATWSEATFPRIVGPLGPDLERPQPINTMVRDRNGTLYLAVDAGGGGPLGAQSMLWATDDDGVTWRDTLGRTFGRHTSFALLEDGRIVGMGGKNSALAGFMPRAVSSDGGRTYEMSSTPFSALNSGQRPSILRLASGRLFMTGDFYPSKRIEKAPSIKEDGSYVALSDDDGATWHVKRLPGNFSVKRGRPSVGYSVARQAPNGVIHLVTSSNRPGLHYELNEAWILSEGSFADDDPAMSRNQATAIRDVVAHRESYPDGTRRMEWSSGVADDGRVLLHGEERWFHPDGSLQREATYELGVKVGRETCRAPDGSRTSEWMHGTGGTSEWTTWWPDGTLRSRSQWKEHVLVPGTDSLYGQGEVFPDR